MKSKPIFIAADLIPALLDGRKICVRKIMKPQPTGEYARIFSEIAPHQPGDILYVKESFHKDESCILYKADNEKLIGYRNMNGKDIAVKWQPAIRMSKKAARIWLKVTNVRVERLQEITEDGCVSEGVYPSRCKGCNATFGCDNCPDEGSNEIDDFSEIWDSTIKKSDLDLYGWKADPWVFVYEFERCEWPEEK